jgi:ABC-type transport system involved in multi-copper enzyme maturation permease subunit
MNALRSLYQITKADLLDRTRRASFLIIIGITIYISILFIPPIEANFLTVSLDQYRGIYNSAWIGTAFGLVASTTLPMFLFYIVKNAISRDTNTGVGKIIAASPIRTSTYILGKWLSNLAVLLLILVVMTIMAGVMQLVRAEDLILKPVTLITPLWLMGVPVFGLVAAAAVLFESINGLKGGLGNVIYFFVLIFATSFTLLTTVGFDDQSPMIEHPANDYMGISYPIASMQSSVLEIAPDYSGSFSIGNSTSSTETLLFNWPGFNWPKETILSRGFWLFAAMMIALAAAIPFRRFDPAHEKIASINSPGFARKHFQKISQPISWGSKLVVKAFTRATKPLIGLISRSRFGTVVLAELRLALRGQSYSIRLLAR